MDAVLRDIRSNGLTYANKDNIGKRNTDDHFTTIMPYNHFFGFIEYTKCMGDSFMDWSPDDDYDRGLMFLRWCDTQEGLDKLVKQLWDELAIGSRTDGKKDRRQRIARFGRGLQPKGHKEKCLIWRCLCKWDWSMDTKEGKTRGRWTNPFMIVAGNCVKTNSKAYMKMKKKNPSLQLLEVFHNTFYHCIIVDNRGKGRVYDFSNGKIMSMSWKYYQKVYKIDIIGTRKPIIEIGHTWTEVPDEEYC
jgi:hypothetical protein